MIVDWLIREPDTTIDGILYMHNITQWHLLKKVKFLRPEHICQWAPGACIVTTNWPPDDTWKPEEKLPAYPGEALKEFTSNIMPFDFTTTSAWEIISKLKHLKAPTVLTARKLAKYLSKFSANGLHDSGPLTIILLGQTGSGKSSFIRTVKNMADGTQEHPIVGKDLSPETIDVNEFMIKDPDDDRDSVRLVDTPGFNGNVKDSEQLRKIREWLKKGPTSKIHGILYLHEITQIREIGSSVRPKDIPQPPGIFLVTTKWDDEINGSREEKEAREIGLQENLGFKKGSMRRFENTYESAWTILDDVRISPATVTQYDLAMKMKKLVGPENWSSQFIEMLAGFFGF
ncbi:hypothetical protein BDN70DRAFT_877925 [Pholiota conissans]|uniref:G domain-containing protein n=1 Tax=Pholiota conissans TaxID=109636 RepID=A0A9P5Z516_9AGAR|nr:hypothetical protein BDN70DRAFT_877925 [Pholiota conissans]